MTNRIWQSLGQDLVNINDYANFLQNIPRFKRTYDTHEIMMAYVTLENMMLLVKHDVT